MNERHFGSDQLDGASDNPINFSSMPELESPLQSPKEKRPYKCNQCDKTYRHAGSLVNHKKTHQIGLYSCLICQKEYSNPMGLKNHLRIHSEEKRFRCSECGECFRMARELSAHSKEAHAFNYGSNGENVPGSQESMGSGTPVVAENSSLISNIENYIAESMVPGDFSQLISKYYPDVNGEVEYEESHNEQLETATELNDVQITDKSSEERRYTCKQCGKAYKHAGSLANHKQTHKVGVYQCGICFKEFSNPMAMKNHCRVHSDSRNSRLFKSPHSTAMLADHATLNNTALAKPQPAINNSRHVQEKCDEQLAMLDGSEGSMSEEETLKAPLDKLCSLQDSPPKRSSPSGKSNGQQTGIDTSIDIGLKDSCNHSTACDDMSAAALTRSFRPEDKASQSQSEQLGQEGTDEEEAKPGESLENRPFKCQACEKTYRHAGSLINHKKTHQTGVYSCSVCSKQLFNMAALKNHLRAHFKSRVGRRLGDSYFEPASFSDELFHSAEESHKCEVCNEILVSKKDFLQHQVFHQQECIKGACNDVAKAEVDTTMENCWGENLQGSQGSSTHSAYSSAPVILDVIKMEIENLSSQQPLEQSSHQGTIEMPGEGFRKESIGDGFKNTLACFEQSSEDQIISKETDFSGVEEHDPTSDDRPYKCEACGRTYRHKSSLLNHKLTHQTGVYKCSICPKQYSNLMALRNHLRFHSRRSSGKQSSTSLQSHQFPHHKLKEHQNMGSPTHVTSLQLSLNEEEAYTTPLNEADVASTEQTAGELPILCSCGKFFNCAKSFQTHSQFCMKTVADSSSTVISTELKSETFLLSEAVVETKEATEAHGNIPEAQEQQTGRKLYECNLCEKSYRHSGSLINHKRTHQTGDYVCSVCSKHVHNLAALKNHLRIHHNVKRRQGERSDISGVLFPDMYFSQGNQEMFICGNCDEIFQSEQDLLTHQEMHLQLGDSWDQGQDLGMMELNATSTEEKESSFMGFEGYNDWESLKVSESVKGTDQDPENEDLDSTEKENCYSCDECGEQFRSAVELTNHKHTHQTGIYQCSFCPKEYPDLLSLRNHFVSHTKLQVLRNGNQEASDGSEDRELVDSLPSYDNRYDCGHCGMIFSNEADFHQHQVAHENQVISSLPGNSVEDDQLREFSFPMHTSEQELLRSINNEMEGGESSDVSDGGPHLSHICGFCGKTYDDLASLEVHSLSHADEVPPADNSHIGAEVDLVDTNMQANTDTKQEEEEKNPVEHSKNDENQECRPYTCDKCGKSYRHGGSLVNHKKTHLVGNFKCFVCSRQYPNLAAFRNHLRHHPKCKKQASYSNIQELQAQSPSDGTHSGDNGEIVISSPASSVPLPDPYASQENANECSNPLYNNTSLQNHTSVHLPSQPHKTRYKSLSRHGGVRSARISGRRRRLVANRSLDDSVQNSSKKDSQNASEASDKPVQICPFCGKVFLFVDELLKHLSESCDSSKCNKETGSTNTVDQVDIKEKAPLSLCSVGQNRETEETSQQRPFRCEVCGRSYRHAGSLINHKQTHKTGIFRCAICQKPFFNLMAMKNHNRIHFELKRHKCLDCGKAFRLCKQLETHQRIHKEKASAKRPGRRNGRVVRPRRGSALQKRKSLCDDVPASNVSKDSSVKDKERRDRKSLGASAKRDPDARPYQCKECGRSYRHAGSLFNHKKSHTMGHYCCSICGKTYPNLMAMKNHQRTHYEAKRHACGECGKTFKWKRQLIRHQRVHIKEQIKQENGTSALESAALSTDLPGAIVAFTQEFEGSSSKAFTEATLQPNCTHCGKVFSYNDLENHVCKEISVTEGPVKVENCQNEVGRPPDSSQGHQAEERPYRCNLCGRTYRHAGSLLNHKNTHKTGLYKCSVCLKQFCNPMAMKNHCRTHTAEKRFQCLECGKAFRSSRELICHERVHTSERPFHCPICNCGFSSKLTLRHHQRSHSKLPSLSTRTVPSSQAVPAEGTKTCEEDPSGSAEVASNIDSSNGQEERRFKCNQCDRSYRHAGSLLNHRKTHSTGVYQCPDCHKEFFNLLALKNHLRIHRYPCPDCGKAFRIASHLATHLKIHEQGGPFTCQHCSKRFFCLSTFEQHQLTHNTQDTDVLEPPPMGNLKVEVT